MATHARRGLSRVFLGSVAERVLRESTCPVLTVRGSESDPDVVGRWMTRSPLTAGPDEKLSSVRARMGTGGFRGMPVVDDGKLVGIISDRDLREHAGYVEVRLVMTSEVLTVNPQTTVRQAARLLRERKIGGMPVMEGDELVGIITSSDLLGALIDRD